MTEESSNLNATIGTFDATSNLTEILKQVALGQSFTVTNQGKAVADITPAYASEKSRARTAINNLLNMNKPTVTDDIFERLKNEGIK